MDSQSSGTLQSTLTESSKSSKGSVAEDKDRDLTKDNAASPIDLECHIQQERITKIIDEALNKVKISLCLPRLVSEFKLIKSALTPQHLEDLLFIYDQYEHPMFSTSLLNVVAMEDIRAGDISMKNRLNPELGHLMYILNSYPVLKPAIDQYISEMKSKYSFTRSRDPQPEMEFLLVFEQFRELMVTLMTNTAADELSATINARKTEASNAKLKKDIKEYSDSLRDETEAFEKAMTINKEIIRKLEQDISILTFEANCKFKKQILDSNRQMVLASRAHSIKDEMLTEEKAESKDSYENTLRQHLLDEKKQRARRFKVQTQLISWIQKYDTEMADKQVELDDLNAQYEEEVEKCRLLDIDLENQNKEFIPLMEERETEYHQELSNKLDAFLKEHAVRVIQTAWRDVLRNRAEKKKLKKLIKKKQQAEEAAALAAEAAARKAAAIEKKAAAAEKKAAKEAAKEAAREAREAKKNEKK